MECSCVRHTELPGTSGLFADLIYHFDRVQDFYPHRPNDIEALLAASKFDFPDDRRAAIVRALTPLNQGNPSLDLLGQTGTVAIVTGQQVGLFSGPAYTVYKALTAIKAARELAERGVPAVPIFWLATEDHDFAEVDHAWVFGADSQPVKIQLSGMPDNGSHPVGGIRLQDIPLDALRSALAGLPFADEAIAIVERAYRPGETMGSAFACMIRELFAPCGLLLIDPMERALREIAAPLMREAVERMPELIDALMVRSQELTGRGYHAQVLVDKTTSLAFLLQDGQRIALRRSDGQFAAQHRKLSTQELAQRAADLSPNALLRPVVQDYLLPTAAYIGGPAELAYLAQSRVLYDKLTGRRPAAFPRAFFTLLDVRSRKRMTRYGLGPTDLFGGEQGLHDTIAARLVPDRLRARLDQTKTAFSGALDSLRGDLQHFDVSLAGALDTSRRKIEYQVEKIARKTATQIMARDEQATRDARSLSGMVFPEKHLQERLYSIVPFLAKFGPGLVDELYSAVRIECPDHQFVVL
ncbi:MAG TPA: bacillithiol biosynthesis cysteine-adding enzyme BshC [Bryobacteraceae bacterium]|jgi:bacillithiol biosynthesis cysteine-adding enzyme BshC